MFAWSRSVRPAFNHTLRAQRDALWLTLQMLTSGVFPASLTDFQLPLDAALAALPVVRLGGVVFRHHLHELARQRGVLEGKQAGSDEVAGQRGRPLQSANQMAALYLCLAYSQVG